MRHVTAAFARRLPGKRQQSFHPGIGFEPPVGQQTMKSQADTNAATNPMQNQRNGQRFPRKEGNRNDRSYVQNAHPNYDGPRQSLPPLFLFRHPTCIGVKFPLLRVSQYKRLGSKRGIHDGPGLQLVGDRKCSDLRRSPVGHGVGLIRYYGRQWCRRRQAIVDAFQMARFKSGNGFAVLQRFQFLFGVEKRVCIIDLMIRDRFVARAGRNHGYTPLLSSLLGTHAFSVQFRIRERFGTIRSKKHLISIRT
jgi:hypothetical protein